MGDAGKAIFGPLFQTIFILTSWYFRPSDRKISYEKYMTPTYFCKRKNYINSKAYNNSRP